MGQSQTREAHADWTRLKVRRWQKYGHDRLYVERRSTTAKLSSLGYIHRVRMVLCAIFVFLATGCGFAADKPVFNGPASSPSSPSPSSPSPSPSAVAAPVPSPAPGVPIPPEGLAEDTSQPNKVIGTGTPAACTSEAVVAAVAAGGVIVFDCGPGPITITMTATAKVRSRVVLDGGGKVTLSGGGARRILYLFSNLQDSPQLTVQNLSFINGNSTGELTEGGGGGAIFVRGGKLKVVNSVFRNNRCDTTGPDLGGAAIRALKAGPQRVGPTVYVVGSTFEAGQCANGGALSSIGVSWVVLNSVMRNNKAIGNGANPARPGTPGGGSGGAIYADGNLITMRLAGCLIEDNNAREGGGAVFFVSNDRSGTMSIERSQLRRNRSEGFQTKGLPGMFFLGARPPAITGSTLS